MCEIESIRQNITNHINMALKFKSQPHLACRVALIGAHECDAGAGWECVNLGNDYGLVREHLTPEQWRQGLATLAKRGVYKTHPDPEFRGDYGLLKVA